MELVIRFLDGSIPYGWTETLRLTDTVWEDEGVASYLRRDRAHCGEASVGRLQRTGALPLVHTSLDEGPGNPAPAPATSACRDIKGAV